MSESGELAKKYVQTKEEEEMVGSEAPVNHVVLSLEDPAAIERGAELDAAANPPGSHQRPQAEVETQDQSA